MLTKLSVLQRIKYDKYHSQDNNFLDNLGYKFQTQTDKDFVNVYFILIIN